MNWKVALTTTFIIILIVILLGFVNNKSVSNMRTSQSTSDVNDSVSTGKLTELITETLREGEEGRTVQEGDTLRVHYTGTLSDGTQFDSSKNPGREPFEFVVGGRVIQGWNQGVIGMKKGEIRKLSIPSSLGYGAMANGSIPANSDLFFEIELLDFVD